MSRLFPAAALFVATAAAIALLASSGNGGGAQVRAEFSNARGLLVGNEVRMNGSPAGSVERIALTSRDTAMVTLRLRDGLPAPRADAVAAIRPVDLLGDVYLDLSSGRATQPLRGPIPLAHTSNAPRLSDLLSAFRPRARAGLQALLVGLGTGLSGRGSDLSRAAVGLRPALEETDRLMTELGSQRAALRKLITDLHAMTGQVASRKGDLAGTVEGVAGTLRALADRSRDLDRGLVVLPGTLDRLRGTAVRLAVAARAGQPTARALGEAAPQLSAAAAELAPFLDAARGAVGDARPLVRSLRALLDDGEPTLGRLRSGLGALRDVAPDVDRLMDVVVPAAPKISEGFFVNFPDQAAEPGTQPFDPFANPARNYWRGAAVFTCEAFGLKIEPGCLQSFLGAGRKRSKGTRGGAERGVVRLPERTTPAPAAEGPPVRAPKLRLPPAPKGVRDVVKGLAGGDGNLAVPDAGPLLDYLLGR